MLLLWVKFTLDITAFSVSATNQVTMSVSLVDEQLSENYAGVVLDTPAYMDSIVGMA